MRETKSISFDKKFQKKLSFFLKPSLLQPLFIFNIFFLHKVGHLFFKERLKSFNFLINQTVKT